MRGRLRALALPALLVALAGQAAPAAADAVKDLGPAAQAAINGLRAASGRAPLTVSGALTRAAADHAGDMARSGRFSHTGRDGSTVGDRVRRHGYGFCFVAENIARGQVTPGAVLDDWMASPGHRRNLLDPRAAEVALVRGPGPVWVMVLGRDGC